MSLNIELIPLLKDNYAALLWSEKSNKAVVIDPSEAKPVLEILHQKNLSLQEIWNTHHHWDHVGGNEELSKKSGAKILCSQHDRIRIAGSSYGFMDGEMHSFEGSSFQVLHIPGHTLGHIAFYSADLRTIFTGDTLFSLGCGRLFEGSPEQMFRSLQRFLELPDDTQLYCGHEYTRKNLSFAQSLEPDSSELREFEKRLDQMGTCSLPSLLKDEKNLNPFLKAKSIIEFQKLRELKDKF